MKYLTMEEQKTLVSTVKETKVAERDFIIIELFLNSGLRVSELAGLLVGDVRNKDRLYVRPETAKRGKGRFIPLHVKAQDLVHTWIRMKLERREGIEDGSPLFVSRLGDPLTKRSIQGMVEKWMNKAGLISGDGEALFSVHSLRHTFAIRFLERNGHTTKALRSLQKILGHATLASTGVYLEATDREMAETMHMMSVSSSRAERLREGL